MTMWQWAGVCIFILLAIYLVYITVCIIQEFVKYFEEIYDDDE